MDSQKKAEVKKESEAKLTQKKRQTNYFLRVAIDRYARVQLLYHVVATEQPQQVYEEWKKIMESHLDARDIAALDALALNEERHDRYMRTYVSSVDKTALKRSDMVGGRNVYDGYSRHVEADDIIFTVHTSS